MSKYGNLKQGDTRTDGKVFFRYDVNGREYWYEKTKYKELVKKKKKNKRIYYHENQKEQNEKLKIWRYANKCKVIESKKKLYQKNKKRIYSIIKSKCDKDQVFKLKLRIRNLICQCFRRKSYKKGSKTENILGCSFDNLKAHIESQFKSGMSWNNWGQWHIDHIMPVSMAKTEDEIIRLNHHRNLRPLWAHENLSKSDKTPETLVLF
jgi:hypothetical protein